MRYFSYILISFVMSLSASAAAQSWQQFGFDAQNSMQIPIAATVSDVGDPVWISDAASLNETGGLVMRPGEPPLVIGWADYGTSTSVKAFNIYNGELVWESPHLERALNETWTTPVVHQDVYLAMGKSIYSIDGETGELNWATNTEYPFVNASPVPAGEFLYCSTYGGFVPSFRRVLKLSRANGEIVDTYEVPGSGHETLLNVDQRLYGLTANGLALADNWRAWNSHDLWNTNHRFFGGLGHNVGQIAAATYNFAGQGELLLIDADTARLIWKQDDALSTDSTPLLMGDRVVLTGHKDISGAGYIAAYSRLDGSELWRTQISINSTAWNLSPVATEDLIYVTGGSPVSNEEAAGLQIIDPASGSVVSTATDASRMARGTPCIGDDGSIYTLYEGGRIACFRAPLLRSFSIEGEEMQTDSLDVHLTLDADFAEEMRLLGPVANKEWSPYSSETTATLTGANGPKRLVIQLRNDSGTIATDASIELQLVMKETGWALK